MLGEKRSSRASVVSSGLEEEPIEDVCAEETISSVSGRDAALQVAHMAEVTGRCALANGKPLEASAGTGGHREPRCQAAGD
jgi:hypothetical protein